MPTVRKHLDFTHPRTLRNEMEYDAAVAEIDELLDSDPTPGSREYDRLEFLSVLVHAFDEEHYQMGASSPQAIVEFLLDQQGKTRAELASLLGGRSRVSEFFAGKRRLSIAQIQKLRAFLNVPADLLLESTS